MTARLELVWPGKDKFLLVPKDVDGKPVWVERDHPAASEVRLTDITGSVGEVPDDPYAANLLFTGDSFDVLHAEGAEPPRMLSIGMHGRLLGRPGRFIALQRFLDRLARHERVWICRRIDIARHWQQQHPATAPAGVSTA